VRTTLHDPTASRPGGINIRLAAADVEGDRCILGSDMECAQFLNRSAANRAALALARSNASVLHRTRSTHSR
jgi:hypothetical protein